MNGSSQRPLLSMISFDVPFILLKTDPPQKINRRVPVNIPSGFAIIMIWERNASYK